MFNDMDLILKVDIVGVIEDFIFWKKKCLLIVLYIFDCFSKSKWIRDVFVVFKWVGRELFN